MGLILFSFSDVAAQEPQLVINDPELKPIGSWLLSMLPELQNVHVTLTKYYSGDNYSQIINRHKIVLVSLWLGLTDTWSFYVFVDPEEKS